jgi:DNA modification methylase
MRTIALSEIQIPSDRQRRDFDPEELMKLTTSIQDNGLLHPVVCRYVQDKIYLVAGERRLRAIKDLWGIGGSLRYDNASIPEGHIPFVSLGELQPIAAMEAELEENIRRKNLTWQEEADAIRRLHQLRRAQNPQQTVGDTAVEVKGSREGSQHESVRQSLIVAEHLADPEVNGAKSQKEAFKILKKKEEQRQNVALGEAVGKTFNAQSHLLLLGKFQELMLPFQYDVVLTDPPYGMGADSFGDAGGSLVTNTHEYEDTLKNWNLLMPKFVAAATQATKPEAHAYVFCDIDRFPTLRALFMEAGWEVHRTPLIWTKPQSHRVPWPDYGPRRHWECILYAVKGKKKTTAIYPDVIDCKLDDNLGHAAQKPVDLLVNLLKRSCRPGDKVVDFFTGTGSIFPAAHQLKVAATGCELSPASYGIALKRLQQLDIQAELGL